MKKMWMFCLAVCIATGVYAQAPKTIKLNVPNYKSGKLLMQALKDRKSTREFSEKNLTTQQMSELLWAANGMNREDGKRTAPTAMNKQEIEVYTVLTDGIYRYLPKQHELQLVASGDYRKVAGSQDYVATAPVNLIYVADLTKIDPKADANYDMTYANIDTGFAAQNAYLYCASAGLNCVVRAYIDKSKLSEIMKLQPTQKIIVGQTIGFPK